VIINKKSSKHIEYDYLSCLADTLVELNPEKLRDLGRAVPAFGKKFARGIAAPEVSELVDPLRARGVSRAGGENTARKGEGGAFVTVGGGCKLNMIGTGPDALERSRSTFP
jgi:hypothetical protein